VETFKGFCNWEAVKVTSMMRKISLKISSYTDGQDIPCVYGY